MLSYLDAKINTVKLHLNANILNVFHLLLDTSYGTHADIKVHTGAMISVGKGSVTSALKKRKINATISTIVKLIGVHEASPQVLCTKAFLQNQGL